MTYILDCKIDHVTSRQASVIYLQVSLHLKFHTSLPLLRIGYLVIGVYLAHLNVDFYENNTTAFMILQIDVPY